MTRKRPSGEITRGRTPSPASAAAPGRVRGDALFYTNAEKHVVRVPILSQKDALELGVPQTLEVRVEYSGFGVAFAVTDRGLITLQPVSEGRGREPIRRVRHWERLLAK